MFEHTWLSISHAYISTLTNSANMEPLSLRMKYPKINNQQSETDHYYA
jgi:hypothetical protein